MLDLIEKELKEMEKEESILTQNGALIYATSMDKVLDMNFRVTTYRSDKEGLEKDFIIAFNQNPELALKWIFYARDTRGGLGEKDLFENCFKYFSSIEPKKACELIPLVPEYGSWKDLVKMLCWGDKEVRNQVLAVIKYTLERDVANMSEKKPISLLAKWLPSINTSSDTSRKLAKIISTYLCLSAKEYRQKLSGLRKYLSIVETQMSANKWREINYSTVPSKANILYKDAFLKKDEIRRTKFLKSLAKGEVKINSSVLYPSDIVKRYTKGNSWCSGTKELDTTLEGLWNNLPRFGIEDTIVVADGSGSMTTQVNGVSPLNVANSLAIYCSEQNSGVFKDKYITFSNKPKFVDFTNCKTLKAKIDLALKHDEVKNTDIEKVFSLILQTAVVNSVPKEEMVKNILIISDMEFDSGSDNNDKKIFEIFKEKYSAAGYDLPRIVFWNVGYSNKGIPLRENDRGVALVSGYSTSIIKMVMSSKLDPSEALKEILMSERYSKVNLN